MYVANDSHSHSGIMESHYRNCIVMGGIIITFFKSNHYFFYYVGSLITDYLESHGPRHRQELSQRQQLLHHQDHCWRNIYKTVNVRKNTEHVGETSLVVEEGSVTLSAIFYFSFLFDRCLLCLNCFSPIHLNCSSHCP